MRKRLFARLINDPGDRAKQRYLEPKGGHLRNRGRRHGTFNHHLDLGQRFFQSGLTDIVLVLSHTDTLGIDFDQFGQRILQPPGN